MARLLTVVSDRGSLMDTSVPHRTVDRQCRTVVDVASNDIPTPVAIPSNRLKIAVPNCRAHRAEW
ncbi:MAG TPA: hypothetical protein VGD43_19800 [Micromonospora sp.]